MVTATHFINATLDETTITISPVMAYYYQEHYGGRYEWVEVGRDAATVDSAGAALVSAAFKNKQVEIGLGGEDMYDTEIANQMPWVMSKFGTGNEKADYNYDHAGGDYRTALKDDWCTTYPISSSNIITIGGPAANVLSEYFNDYTDAFLIKSDVSTSDLTGNGIYAPGCWNKTRAYYGGASGAGGYAVISTYKDLNGTIGFIVWGYNGDDTFYASYAMRHGLIAYLQYLQSGATTLILKLTYTGSCAPTISIVECLGIFTECTGFGQFRYLGEGGSTYVRTTYVLPEARRLFIEHKLMSFTWPTNIHADP